MTAAVSLFAGCIKHSFDYTNLHGQLCPIISQKSTAFTLVSKIDNHNSFLSMFIVDSIVRLVTNTNLPP